ncbi:pentatricopeptide repeat-containing protein At1g61870, mitochondrial-like [Punica granatum]|uniref:Uncharacterized protein n=2 Tax=Punica granatum TaxID=22663 RepID=A0A2I0IH54_PUNGR|nr:pentatricopeptide repeat-containing protein At1g61870, mitochondrial-like [Punica granatum]PKI43020.1 hypothetical protein CRG98_036598 [Punica granatum]
MASLLRHPALRIPKSLFSTAAAAATRTPQPPPLPPPFPAFRAARSAILSERDPEKLTKLFEQCSAFATFRRHRPLYRRSIAKLARAKRLDLVDRLVGNEAQNSVSKTEGFWIRLMMLYSSAGMPEQALGVFNSVCDTKACPLTERSLCAFLTIHLKSKSPESLNLPELLRTASDKINLKPTAQSLNLVLKALVQWRDVDSAVNWVKEMETVWNVKPTIESYTILLRAHLKNGNFSAFDGVVKEIARKSLECNLAAYNLRIMRLCKGKECARAKKLLDEMLAKGIGPSSTSYNAIIDGNCRLGDFESAKKVLDSMPTRPSSHPYFSLIRAMVKEEEFDSALEVCKEIMRRKWIPPFEATQGLVDGLLKMSRREEAKMVVEKMKKRLKGEAVGSWANIEAAIPL